MKTGTTDKRKFKQLLRDLRPFLGDIKSVDLVTVVIGLLERMWLFTSGSAIRGDIGKYTNEEIAEDIGWTGDCDVLINALVNRHWLDESPDPAVRLVVHDWHDHAPKHVLGNAAKVGGIYPNSKPTGGDSPKESPLGSGPPNQTHSIPVNSNPVKPVTAKPDAGAGVLKNLDTGVLDDDEKFSEWFNFVSSKPNPLFGPSEHNRIMVFAAWERAKVHGKPPLRLFKHIVSKDSKNGWKLITNEFEERARKRLQEYNNRSRKTHSTSSNETISLQQLLDQRRKELELK
jgi:hypothetical protein